VSRHTQSRLPVMPSSVTRHAPRPTPHAPALPIVCRCALQRDGAGSLASEECVGAMAQRLLWQGPVSCRASGLCLTLSRIILANGPSHYRGGEERQGVRSGEGKRKESGQKAAAKLSRSVCSGQIRIRDCTSALRVTYWCRHHDRPRVLR
jgi:hypothetical protein